MAEVEGHELLAKAKRGDPRAFEALIRPYVATVRRFAGSLTKTRDDADDLAQEALLKAFRSIGTFEERSSLSTWLFSVTRSVGLDRLRSRQEKERRVSDEYEDDVADESRSADALLAEKGETELLWRAIKRLPPDFRIALVLFDIEGLSYEEVSEIERVPVGTVRSRLSRARARLREFLVGESSISGTSGVDVPSHPRRPE